MKYAFAAAMLNAAYATAVEEKIVHDPYDNYNYYYNPSPAQYDARDPWSYQSAFEWDFDAIHDEAQEVYFGTDSESEINDETDDSWSSHEGYTINSDSETSDATIVHRNSSDDSDCDTWNPCTSDQHSHSSESLHNASDSHCHGSDCDSSSDDSSHYGHHSSSDSHDDSSSHSNDSSYPFSSESDGHHDIKDTGYTIRGYSPEHHERSYQPNRHYVSYH